jgi:hypothetical protein
MQIRCSQSTQPLHGPTTTLITDANAREHYVMANGSTITFPADGCTPEVKPWVPKDQLVRTLYDAASEKGMTTGQVDWVAINGAKNVRWQFEERPSIESPTAKDLIAERLITQDEVATFGLNSSPAGRDEICYCSICSKQTPFSTNTELLHRLPMLPTHTPTIASREL